MDPLVETYGAEGDAFIDAALLGEDARLRKRVQNGRSQAVWDKGLRSQALREVNALAANIVESMSPLDRDRLGFTTRNSLRDEILEPYLRTVESRRRGHVAQEARRLERTQFEKNREARYATAARALLERGHTAKAVSATLKIGAGALSRILSARPEDIDLEASDPIIVTLAPELGTQTEPA